MISHMTMQPADAGREQTTSLRELVAEDVRAELARRRLSGSALAVLLGQSQKWVSRRLSGEVAFDVDDLERIARALGLGVGVFLDGGRATSARPLQLPRLDSNQQPADYRSALSSAA